MPLVELWKLTPLCSAVASLLFCSQVSYDVNFVSWQVIAKARVPIVKFVERISGIPFDIRLYFVFSYS